MAKKRANTSKLIANKELEIIVRELLTYEDNKRCIKLIKNFEKSAQNKYSL